MILRQADDSPIPPYRDIRKRWPSSRFSIGPLLERDDFGDPLLKQWQPELEGGGTVTAKNNRLIIDVPKGCTVWYRTELSGPVLIEYEALVVRKGGTNDRVSDLNCFWMAQDPAQPGKLLQTHRSGKFADYDSLCTYYVGYGGNTNTTTRFRRYIGKAGDRPLLPEHDLREAEFLIRPNYWQTIRLITCDQLIQYYHNDRLLFEQNDPQPYTRGWFGLRTVTSHLQIARFRVYRLTPNL